MTQGTLFVVATPLGNLGDLTHRAVEVLRTVALVAAEDTRRTRVLLSVSEASPRLLAVHQHSPPKRLEEVIAVLADGADVAVVTDAGTPGVSDPGMALVRMAHERGVPVRVVPGPSAVSAALSISGFPADRYTFLGFPPRSGRRRGDFLRIAADSPWTCVLFEAPNRVATLLKDLAAACGADRGVAVARELTKVHEELKLGTLSELAGYYWENSPRGEVTIVVAGSDAADAVDPVPDEEVREVARALLAEGMTRRDAVPRVAQECRISRNAAYRIVSEL